MNFRASKTKYRIVKIIRRYLGNFLLVSSFTEYNKEATPKELMIIIRIMLRTNNEK